MPVLSPLQVLTQQEEEGATLDPPDSDAFPPNPGHPPPSRC